MRDLSKIASRVAARVHVGMSDRNVQLVNKMAQAASSFADRIRCNEGDEPDVAAVRGAFEELFEVWRDVEAGLVDDEPAAGSGPVAAGSSSSR